MGIQRWVLVFVLTGIIAIVFLILLLASRSPVKNYTHPKEPFYEGNYAGEQAAYDGSIKVVTWNLNFAEGVITAINALQQVEELRDAHILLLQEMDEASVEQLAQALHYNYVYFPAAIHRRHRKNFGNAVLSKWPIYAPEKIILPNAWGNAKQTRLVTKAMLTLDDQEIVVYSVHLDMVWMLPGMGQNQVEYFVEQVEKEQDYVILGGDFNSWNKYSIDYLEDQYGQIGVERVTNGTGHTFESQGLKLTLDHIFASEGLDYEAGVWRDIKASDHFPVWAIIRFEEMK